MERTRLVWADKRTPTRTAYTQIGAWPGQVQWTGRHARRAALRNGAAVGSPSHSHAAEAWEAARTAASRSAVGVPLEMANLAMVSALANHLNSCARCWRTGPLDAATPAQWLTWGVRCRPRLWKVFAPALLELGVPTGGLTMAPTPQLPGR